MTDNFFCYFRRGTIVLYRYIIIILVQSSNVARGAGYSPPLIGMLTKMQNGKNTMFLALLRQFYALEWTK